MQTKSNFIYKITIDKKNNIPVEVLQKNDLNGDFIKTNFSNIHLAPKQPTENSWFYSTYLDKYKPINQKEIPQLISVGSFASDWTLPYHNKNENVSLSELKGKVILLDFWIKNCSPCIASVPHINAIKESYKNKEFEIFGINTWDSKKDIDWFCNKHEVAFNVLMDGKDIAEKYGIDSYPTIILIGKKGEVLYSGGFDKAKIEELINKAL